MYIVFACICLNNRLIYKINSNKAYVYVDN